ncbi:MAG TPA: hypothetical protein LFW10_03580 [Rickettsia endosymbiont of Diachasma alloeum]|nr:hypothetical protein [Rickettsia endosymbiont of Diachasma alloeum]
MKRKLTEEHIRKLKRIMRDPISCFNESDEELLAQELPKTLEERIRLSDEISKHIAFQIFNSTEEVIFNYGTIGNKLLNQGKIQEAMAAYKLAIEYGKDNKFFTDNYYPIPYLGLGLIFENEQPKKALAFFNKAINMLTT